MIRNNLARIGYGGLLSMLLLAGNAAPQVHAGSVVTYSWVTDSYLGTPPTSATFQVALSAVESGVIQESDITNIQFSFPGIDPLPYTTPSSIGSDNAAYVDPITGLPVMHDANQGLAAVAYHDMLFGSVFLSITFDNPGGDEFNAINGGPGSLGFGSGHWTASFPAAVTPEPGSFALFAVGAVAVAGYRAMRRRHQRS